MTINIYIGVEIPVDKVDALLKYSWNISKPGTPLTEIDPNWRRWLDEPRGYEIIYNATGYTIYNSTSNGVQVYIYGKDITSKSIVSQKSLQQVSLEEIINDGYNLQSVISRLGAIQSPKIIVVQN